MVVSKDFSPDSNWLLSALNPDDFSRLKTQAREVPLEVGTVLYEARRPIPYVYFLTSGLVSVVTSMEDGTTIEVMIVGREGIVGLSALHSSKVTVSTRAFMQISGVGFKVEADFMRKEFQQNARLRELLFGYFQFAFAQVSQCAACNRLHSLEERLARWLLMVQDREVSDQFKLTHEFLGQMLGTRRPSVSLAAAALQRQGLIRYHRGQIDILDRKRLEKVSCECYPLIKESWDVLSELAIGRS
jgi:CRP-like cAMP-binding protein